MTFDPILVLQLTKGIFCINYPRKSIEIYPMDRIEKLTKEADMLEVTEKASEMIKDFLKDRDEIPPIRIMLSQGG